MQQPADLVNRAAFGLNHAERLIHQADHGLQMLFAFPDVIDLFLGDFRREARKPGEIEQQMVQKTVVVIINIMVSITGQWEIKVVLKVTLLEVFCFCN